MIFRTLEKYFYGVVIYYQHFAKSRKRPRNLLQCFSPPGAACFIRNTSIKVLCTEEENENLNNTKTLAADLCTNFRQIDKSNHQNRVRPFNPRKKDRPTGHIIITVLRQIHLIFSTRFRVNLGDQDIIPKIEFSRTENFSLSWKSKTPVFIFP